MIIDTIGNHGPPQSLDLQKTTGTVETSLHGGRGIEALSALYRFHLASLVDLLFVLGVLVLVFSCSDDPGCLRFPAVLDDEDGGGDRPRGVDDDSGVMFIAPLETVAERRFHALMMAMETRMAKITIPKN